MPPPVLPVGGAVVWNCGGSENGSRPEKMGLGLGPPCDGDTLPLGPVTPGPVTVGPVAVDGPTDSGGNAGAPPLPNWPRPSSASTSTAATMPPTFSALRSRSFSGIRQAPWLVTAAGEAPVGAGVAAGAVAPAAEVGPGVEPGPAL